MSLHSIAWLFAWTVATPSAAATSSTEAAATPITRVATVEGVSEFRHTPTGARLLVVPDPSRSTVTVVQTILSGAVDDALGAHGAGHLVEHVASMQTKNFPNLSEQSARRGASWGAQIKLERIEFNFTLPATPENLAWALDVAADRIQNPDYSPEAAARELAAMRQEEDIYRSDAREWMWRRAMGYSHRSHPYGQEGAIQDLDQLTPARLLEYHTRHFRPDNMLVVVAGPIDPEQAAAAFARACARLPTPNTPRPERSTTREPDKEGELTFRIERPGDQNAVLLAYRTPPPSHPDHAALAVLASILGPSSANGLADTKTFARHGARVTVDLDPQSQSGLLAIHVQADATWPIEAMEAEVKRALAERIRRTHANDVQAAKGRLAQSWRAQFNDSKALAFQLGAWQSQGDWRIGFTTRDDLARVALTDVVRVAQSILTPSNCTTGLLIARPAPAPTPISPPELARAEQYSSAVAPPTGESFGWTVPELAARTRYLDLTPGLRAAMTPVELRGGRAIVLVALRLDPDAFDPAVMALLSEMLLRGSRRLDRAAFEAELQRLETSVELTPVPGGFLWIADSYGGHAAALVELLGEALREPRWDAAEFERLRAERLGHLGAVAELPQDAAEYACLSGATPDAGALTRSLRALRALRLPELKAAHRDLLKAASGQIVVVGSGQATTLEGSLHRAFEGWAPRKIAPTPRRVSESASAKRDVVELRHAKVGAMCATLEFPPLLGHGGAAGAQLAATLLATAEVSETRLGQRLRLKDELSYLVLGRLEDAPRRPAPTLRLSITYPPERRGELVAALEDEIARAASRGFTAAELETGKKLWSNRRMILFSNPLRLAQLIAGQLANGTTFEEERELARAVEATSSEDVVASIQKIFSPGRMRRIFAGPSRVSMPTGE